MRILITGASGFVGRNLLKKFTNSKYKVLALYNKNRPNNIKNKNINFLKFNIQKKNNFKKIEKFKPNIIIHLAWKGIPNFSYSNCNFNFKYSLSFLSKVLNFKSCKKLIVVGSSYEKNSKSSNIKNLVLFKNKLRKKLEQICNKKKIDFGWFRVFYVFGPGQREKSLVPYLINSLMNNKKPKIKNLFNRNDFIYIDDVTKVLFQAVKRKLNFLIFEIGSGKLVYVYKICMIIEKIITNKNIFFKPFDLKSTKLNNTVEMKASLKILKYKFKNFKTLGIEKSLKKMILNRVNRNL